MAPVLSALVLLLLCVVFPVEAIARRTLYDALYKDPNQPVEARVQDLFKRMSLDEKLGQMTQIERAVANSSVIDTYEIGSPSISYLVVSSIQI